MPKRGERCMTWKPKKNLHLEIRNSIKISFLEYKKQVSPIQIRIKGKIGGNMVQQIHQKVKLMELTPIDTHVTREKTTSRPKMK